ncbi:MAG: right-handed parallel beta-helix repeat-containing protein [bacterium]
MTRFLFLMVLLIAFAHESSAVQVDGYCYLEGQSDHSGTKVRFVAVSPSAVTDSTYTEASGYFSIDLVMGVYDVEFTHAGFQACTVEDQVFTINTTMSPVALQGLPLSGSLSGVVGPGYYHVVSNISIISGDSLGIQPGTTFLFDGPYSFSIYGTLLAAGTESDSILFTTDTLTNPDRWRGLRFHSGSSGSMLAYCLIEHGLAVGDWQCNRGGGVYCDSSSPAFTHCRISNNLVTAAGTNAHCHGGGVCCDYYSSPTFTSCAITCNSTTEAGGGVYCDFRSSPTFSNCTISDNSAADTGVHSYPYGGGIYCYDLSSPNFTNCAITGNSTTAGAAGYSLGGGVYCGSSSSPTFTNCTFRGNSTTSGAAGYSLGGGVYCGSSLLTLTNCTFSGNSTTGGSWIGGGAVYCIGSSPILMNCTISGNSTSGLGGGVYCRESSPIFKCTIIAFSEGSGIYFHSSPESQLDYCDIFGNTGGDIAFEGGDPLHGPAAIGQLFLTNANGDSCDLYYNIFLDPMFVNASAEDFRLWTNSPCIDAGDPNLPLDPDGTVTDIGAFYYDQRYHPPSPFSLLSPHWGDTCWTLDTILIWQAAIDPDSGDIVTYEVWLDTLASFSTAWQIASAHFDTVFSLEGLDDDHTYYWTVHASDLNSPGTWADDTLMFRTYLPEPPESFALALPENGDTVFTATPTLRWRKAFDPDPGDEIQYHLMWSYEGDFSVYEDTTLSDTSFAFPPGLLLSRGTSTGKERMPLRVWTPTTAKKFRALDEVEDDSTVYWKVEASDRFGFSVLCEPEEGWCFHVYIEQPPNAFNLLSPANGDTLDSLAVELIWETSGDPDPGDSVAFFRVYLAFDSTFSTDLDSQDVSTTALVWDELVDGESYWWKVKAFDTHGNETLSDETRSFHIQSSQISGEEVLLPTAYALHPNWPNPFNSSTMIRYDVPQAGKVSLTIYSLLGQRVATLYDSWQAAGSHTISWDVADLPSGVYFCRMQAAGFMQTRKMLLVK